MKKYNVQLASLVLFFAIFAPGVAVGMKELPGEDIFTPKFMGYGEDFPSLPPDVRRIIANKTLELMLDDAQDDPEVLMELGSGQQSLSEKVARYITSIFRQTHKTPVIDFIILLIENGADPNTKNSAGNTVLRLLIMNFVSTLERIPKIDFSIGGDALEEWGNETRPHNHLGGFQFYLNALKVKIELLAKLKINLNEKINGETAAHIVIRSACELGYIVSSMEYGGKESLFNTGGLITRVRGFDKMWAFIFELKKLGMDFTTIKDNNERTACEFGRAFEEENRIGDYNREQLRKFCSAESSWRW